MQAAAPLRSFGGLAAQFAAQVTAYVNLSFARAMS
jgi:hypothetical protein